MTEEILEKYRRYLNPSFVRLLKFAGYDSVETEAEGVYIRDDEGNRYLDCAGGNGIFSMGHAHPDIIAAVRAQLDRMPLSSKLFLNRLQADLAERLNSITPGKLQYSFLCNSGAEAVEGALKTARLSTGRTEIISAEGAFHGKTFGALSASGRDIYRDPFEPLLPDFRQVPFGNASALAEAVSERTAAVILEPVQGEGGIIIPPDDYLPEVAHICRAAGALLILDEVQTGLGRTGRTFAFEHFGIEPDLLVLAKALGGGVMPAGAFMGTPEVWECYSPYPLIHTSSFGGNPLACAAALAALDVMVAEDLPSRAVEMGELLMDLLREIAQRHADLIAAVRGLGLMIGVEMHQEGYAGSVITNMTRRHVTAAYTLNQPRVIRFEPPLIIREEEVREAARVFEESVTETGEKLLRN
ncbi:aspartate aminotransferase family protein [Gemmatimonadota bacterium]